jgi:hypothetical protein
MINLVSIYFYGLKFQRPSEFAILLVYKPHSLLTTHLKTINSIGRVSRLQRGS